MELARQVFCILLMWMPQEHAEIATRQAVWESGWFKSYAFLEYNNPFGMMWKGKHQKFDNLEEGCYQYYRQIYCQYEQRGGGDYYQFLVDLPYAMGKDYVKCLKSLKLELECH